MKSPDEIYFRIRFADGGIRHRWASDQDIFERFCRRYEGKTGYIVLYVGEISKSLQQLRFFHGPLIDAFVELTGDTDRDRWKEHLKETYLDRDKPDEVPSLAQISMRRMSRFIQRCVDALADQGGSLNEYETREYREVTDGDHREEAQALCAEMH